MFKENSYATKSAFLGPKKYKSGQNGYFWFWRKIHIMLMVG